MIVVKKRIVHIDPTYNICDTVTRLLAITIAFGGVLMGKSKAVETEYATGIKTDTGEIPYEGPTHAIEGKSTLAAATLDIRFVVKQEKNDALAINPGKLVWS